jgi:hypothetical protein
MASPWALYVCVRLGELEYQTQCSATTATGFGAIKLPHVDDVWSLAEIRRVVLFPVPTFHVEVEVTGTLDRDMSHRSARGGTVPVPRLGRVADDVPARTTCTPCSSATTPTPSVTKRC